MSEDAQKGAKDEVALLCTTQLSAPLRQGKSGAIAHVEPSQPRRRLAHPHIIAYYDAFFEAQ
jgi:hypothetical protein